MSAGWKTLNIQKKKKTLDYRPIGGGGGRRRRRRKKKKKKTWTTIKETTGWIQS
jgi:hypothetical protein